MKKIISLFVVLGLFISLSGCSTQQDQQSNHNGTQQTSDDYVLIQGGSFTMGSRESEIWRSNDETQHIVTVSDFYMSPYEMTQKEYEELTNSNPSTFSGESLPVENVTWLEAVQAANLKSEQQ